MGRSLDFTDVTCALVLSDTPEDFYTRTLRFNLLVTGGSVLILVSLVVVSVFLAASEADQGSKTLRCPACLKMKGVGFQYKRQSA